VRDRLERIRHTVAKAPDGFPRSAADQLEEWDLAFAATYQDLSGIPIAASYVATNAEIAPRLGRNLAAGARGRVTINLIEPNTMFEDRRRQLDIRLSRSFPVGQARLLGTFELYNAFNHTQFSGVDTGARFDAQGRQVNGRFGEYTGARPARRIQMALKLYF
jgi:hypothetical protein